MSIEQQPEAWIVINKETGYRIQVSLFPDLYNKDMFEVIPLYTHPKPEQEPVAWIATGIGGGTAVGWYEKDIVNLPKGTKLYLHPPKRERLSDGEISKNTANNIPLGEKLAFHAGIRWAEHQHGIGVDDETK
jgi:hypothetical protein